MASPSLFVCFVCQENGEEDNFNSPRLVCCGNSVHQDCHNQYVGHHNTNCGLCRSLLPVMENKEEEEEEEELVGRYVFLFSTKPYMFISNAFLFFFSLNLMVFLQY